MKAQICDQDIYQHFYQSLIGYRVDLAPVVFFLISLFRSVLASFEKGVSAVGLSVGKIFKTPFLGFISSFFKVVYTFIF